MGSTGDYRDGQLDALSAVSKDAAPAITALREALAEQPAPPPECQTEAEKTAYAFGWFKALESVQKQPAQQEPVQETLQQQLEKAEDELYNVRADIRRIQQIIMRQS